MKLDGVAAFGAVVDAGSISEATRRLCAAIRRIADTQDPGDRNLAAAQAAVDACFASGDYIEGRTAFLQKRKPIFRAR